MTEAPFLLNEIKLEIVTKLFLNFVKIKYKSIKNMFSKVLESYFGGLLHTIKYSTI